MIMKPNPLVGMDACVNVIIEHFEKCRCERAVLAAREQFLEEWNTLVEALQCPPVLRTPYQCSLVEECEEVHHYYER